MTAGRPALVAAGPLAAAVLTVVLTVVLTAAACGSSSPGPSATVPAISAPAGSGSLATSFASAQGSWAIVPMGGAAAGDGTFWELFAEPDRTSGWSLVTPPGVADNGGLVATGRPGSGTVTAGFLASQGLAFSPTATSTDGGKTWTAGVLGSALADVSDALSTGPSGVTAALFRDGAVDVRREPGAAWSQLTTAQRVAAQERRDSAYTGLSPCGFDGLAAVAADRAGNVQIASNCTRPGGLSFYLAPGPSSQSWTFDPPILPASYAGQMVRVLRMTGGTVVLRAGADLLVSWQSAGGWSPLVALPGAGPDVRAIGFGGGNGLGQSVWVLSGGRAAVIAGPFTQWQHLPAVPHGTAALADDVALPGSGPDALAVSGDTLTVWRLTAGSWARIQVISVPIVAGSSA